jgi:hypothetical protein
VTERQIVKIGFSMFCFLLGLRGVMNQMTVAYKTPNAPKNCYWLYNLHNVHIEGEEMRTYDGYDLPLYQVRIGTERCYVPMHTVDIRREPAKATVDVSLRTRPDMLSPIIDLIYKDREILVYDLEGEFLDVEYRGRRGYIKANTCDHQEPFYPGNNDGERAVSIVKSKIGCKYVLAGPSTGPYIFDCSGLMMWTFNRLDIFINRTANNQIYGLEEIPKDDMSKWLPGDVITFYTDSSRPNHVSHVGMYIGDGQFIHASTNGYVVRYQDYKSYPYETAHVSRYFTV